MNVMKLLLHEKVEVRQIEAGLRGSWYQGLVVGISDFCREVEYDELLCESGDSKLIESIPVTGAIKGIYQHPYAKSHHRGRIRPLSSLPKQCSIIPRLRFGVCVDALFEEAWWEGIIFDCDDGSNERSVFFPDEGDEHRFKVTDLRVSYDWDEFSGNWRERGVWMLVKLAQERDIGIPPIHIKYIWSHLRVNYGFLKMISEWTCGSYCIWKKYFTEVVCDIVAKTSRRSLGYPNNCRVFAVIDGHNKAKMSQCSDINGSSVTRSIQKRKGKGSAQAVRQKQQYYCAASKRGHLTVDLKKNQLATDVVDGKSAEIPSAFSVQLSGRDNHGAFLTEKQQFDRMKSGLPEHKHLTVCKGVQKWFLEDCQRSGMELSSDVSLQQANRTTQNVSSMVANACRVENNQKASQNGPSIRRRLLKDSKMNRKKFKPVVSYKHSLKRYGSNGSKMERGIVLGMISIVQHNRSVKRRKNLRMPSQPKRILAKRFPKGSQGQSGIKVTHGFSNHKLHLKIKKRVPKKIQKASAKTSSKKAEVLEPVQKDLLSSSCCGPQYIGASGDEFRLQDVVASLQRLRLKRAKRCDSVCFICQYGGDLLPCDHCMSSYHFTCVNLEDVPSGKWFCPSCRCGICGSRSSADDQQFTKICYQCSRQYHVDCLNKARFSFSKGHLSDKFCSNRCFEICAHLHELLNTSNPTSVDGLTWTITRSRRNDCNIHYERVHPQIQLSQVFSVFHECFQPIIEPHTGRDLVADIVYNSGSKFGRLDFHGFYVMVLLSGEEPLCVATLRIHGQKVVEMPLVATPFKYRRRGMCRLLVHELEKMLINMGIERLVLPAISQLRETWLTSFGFTEMSDALRQELSGYPFVLFQGTALFEKVLCKTNLVSYSSHASQNPQRTVAGVSQDCSVSHDINSGRKFGLKYSRKKKSDALGEDKMRMKRQNAETRPIRYVYKRRRVQAGRDSSFGHGEC
ncbi:hypothetical protein Nepgr_013219 [Nepenthes gracilis]|uniref:Uncharacterized protein n=1 Tax=Nepenthes gracilis TaxID=150966 RepID=A0AAD3SHD3_NEPGR|nr:hypothetical protein Nepgr_013219 [Nepenthes gracilis]